MEQNPNAEVSSVSTGAQGNGTRSADSRLGSSEAASACDDFIRAPYCANGKASCTFDMCILKLTDM